MIEDKFDLTYYSGKDLYSDGDVEEELLSAVADTENIENTLIEGNSWPHLYHLSPIRENILEWYDFDKKGSLLEIGSGCGALSGLFCDKVDHVVAIELSKRRSTINATRNEKHKNLKIMLGNFEDIKLTEKFDYVTLIGVFEYSICYINSENPFMDMLNRAKGFLKPGGKLFIAIENKYGLKYFAGASEDHTGRCFDGIENYVGVDRVRTFSRGTLCRMLREAGFSQNEFYYPMPDYKLPDTIYSEERQPSFGSIRNACTAYDRDRYELMDERLAYDSICEDGMFGEFANSFLVVSSVEGDCSEDCDNNNPGYGKTLYAKYNRLRAPKYQIATRIYRDEHGRELVSKYALRDEAVSHIERLSENYRLLNEAGDSPKPVEILSCSEGRACFPCVKGDGLDRAINKSLHNREQFIKAINETLDKIYCAKAGEAFVYTEEFGKIFGGLTDDEKEKLTGLKCKRVSNIDSTFGNFMTDENGEVVSLDYEWVCPFPVPEMFLRYRTVYYYCCENAAYILKLAGVDEVLKLSGIDMEFVDIFKRMDDNFQQYVHGKDRKYMYTSNYAKRVHNIGKNLQMNEEWFKSVVCDLDGLNHSLGPDRRDLVTAHIVAHRKSQLGEKIRRNLKHPVRGMLKMLKQIFR